jgi:radical SAM superfamily enzyme YgiQ (UPF0313 family)
MQIPRRTRGDELLAPGQMVRLRERLRLLAPANDLATVIAYAFDHRTRMLPFIYTDTRMAPAGVRAIGAAMVDCGFAKTRIVLQQWNRQFSPWRMRLDGRIPDLFMVSTMGMHWPRAMDMIRDARRIDPANRPLIIAGGSKAAHEAYDFFGTDPAAPDGADVVVIGEEFVLLSLLEVVLSFRAAGESMRSSFYRARDAGALDGVPGLMYARGGRDKPAEELVFTGTQRLLGDLDELPHPVLGYRLLEPPSRRATLGPSALEAGRVRRYSPVSSLVVTFGCKFSCPYCPIPNYNQQQHRLKSGLRIADEMWRLYKEYGLRYFFGADDNFFNDRQRTLDIVDALVKAEFDGTPLRRIVRWYTEVTVHDTLQMKDHLPLIREAGCRALWLGVEDMTGTLVRKGQTASNTLEAFRRLRDAGICPMPMMMHHDSQPLYTRGSDYGLINQIRQLRRSGAASLQVLMLVPSPGSKLYEETYTSGQVFQSVGGRPVEAHIHDGNHVIASRHKQPWRKQVNLLLAYLYFYNPLWLIVALWRRKTKLQLKPAAMQMVGILGVIQNIRRTLGWTIRLAFGRIRRLTLPPGPKVPIRLAEAGSLPVQRPTDPDAS